MSSKADRLHTARRFCQLLAGGWGQVEAAKIAGAEARRDKLADPARGRGPVGTATGGTRRRRSLMYAVGLEEGRTG